jgi:predicted O-methyltransferase YrrM
MPIDRKIAAVIDEIDSYRKTKDDSWQIPRVEGELLHHIALSANAKVVVEVGTSYGFSGLFWGAALRQTGGRLHTIDVSQKKYEASREAFARAGLTNVITNHLGDAHDVLKTITGPVDIAFIDADKPRCRAYFELVWPKIRAGGSVLTDNATTHRAELADYVKHLRSLPDASSVEVAVGNGIEWTIKTSKE